jgi:hypothetical protein
MAQLDLKEGRGGRRGGRGGAAKNYTYCIV